MGDIVKLPWMLIQMVLLTAWADFLGGLFHWAEDTLGDEHSPIWGWIVRILRNTPAAASRNGIAASKTL